MSTNEEYGRFSRTQIAQIRESLDNNNIGLLGDEIVVACGSYGRKDATPQSDIDYYIITGRNEEGLKDSIRSEILQIVGEERGPSPSGLFGGLHDPDKLVDNIGGVNDDNESMTRRILLLQEGEWLFNEDGFRRMRRSILERYVSDRTKDHNLARFLLNDIIRYYRTISVDYEFKIQDKRWAIRYLKLIFSRKLLYISSVFPVAETCNKSRAEKIDTLEELFSLPVIERMQRICGGREFQPVLNLYNKFLDFLAQESNRNYLEALNIQNRDDEIFLEMKAIGDEFTKQLMDLFHAQYPDKDHPIHEAIMF